MAAQAADFEHLVPETMLNAVEQALGKRLSGMATPLPSYINRVYAVETEDGTPLIAKFYRPGRWTVDALMEEHAFVTECAAEEIPVIAPLALGKGVTLHEADGIRFALFPKRFGRQLEIASDEDWTRVGRLLGRVHTVGARYHAQHRTDAHPSVSTDTHVAHLLDGGFVTPEWIEPFAEVTDRILDRIQELFDDVEFIRIHGDCHCGNILDRPDDGLVLIDFDDMMMGPPVQDFWLLLPEHADQAQRELDLLLRGYEQFRAFDRHALRLIEPLRAMRIIYYLAWCSRQVQDYRFRNANPGWGSDTFWEREVADLEDQLAVIEEHLG